MSPAANAEWWTRQDVAEFLGVQPVSVSVYVQQGRMPKPDHRIGVSPRWRPETIRAWHVDRKSQQAAAPVPMTFRVPEDMDAALRAEAWRRNRSVSRLLRDIVAEWMAANRPGV